MKRTILLLALAACSPSLEVPDGVSVTCASNADCFIGQCIHNACIVVNDNTPPRLLNAHAASDTSVTLSFNEPLGDSATDVDGYTTIPPLTFTSAALSVDGASITLQTSAGLGHAVAYVITVTRATDVAGNLVDAAAASAGFGSYFGAPSGLVPSALAPREYAIAPHLTSTLTWLPVLDAETYTIEVAVDASFSPLAIAAVTVPAPATQTIVTVPSAISYVWRVRADVSPTDAYDASGSFDALDETIHVFCPDGEPCDAAQPLQRGNAVHPLRSVQAAVVLAQSLGANTVAIAGRGGSGRYSENVIVRDTTVGIIGGYDPAFTTINTTDHPTIIEAYAAVLELDNVTAPAHIDHLSVASATQSASPIGILVNGCSAAVTINDVSVDLAGLQTGPSGIMVTNATADCDVHASVLAVNAIGPSPNGMSVSDANFTIDHSNIDVQSVADQGVGIFLADTTAARHIDIGSTGVSITGTTNTLGIVLQAAQVGDYVVHDSVVGTSAGNGIQGNFAQIAHSLVVARGGGSYGVVVPRPQRTVLTDSVVIGDNIGVDNVNIVVGNTIVAPQALIGATVITNNLLVASIRCIELQVEPQFGDVASLQNNAFADCTQLLDAPDFTGNDLTTVAGLDGTHTLSGNQRRVTGNVATMQTPTEIFMTPASNDYRLKLVSDPAGIKTGGKDATGSTCGTAESPVSCGGSGTDYGGATRSAPISIGAYEAN